MEGGLLAAGISLAGHPCMGLCAHSIPCGHCWVLCPSMFLHCLGTLLCYSRLVTRASAATTSKHSRRHRGHCCNTPSFSRMANAMMVVMSWSHASLKAGQVHRVWDLSSA